MFDYKFARNLLIKVLAMAITHTHTHAASDRHYSKRVCLCSRLSKWKSHLGGNRNLHMLARKNFSIETSMFANFCSNRFACATYFFTRCITFGVENRCDLRIECVCVCVYVSKWFENVKSSSFTHAHPLNTKLLSLLLLLPIRNCSTQCQHITPGP